MMTLRDVEGNIRDLLSKYCLSIRLVGPKETTNNIKQNS
jgi:hypothetical protein